MKPLTPPAAKKTQRSDARRRQMALDTTYREASYIEWLSKNRIPVVVKLVDDQEAQGWIEYYDRDIIRLTRSGGSNLFIFKARIKYLYEDPRNLWRKRKHLSNF